MVLYYGLLALETANNTVVASTSSNRTSLPRPRNSVKTMSSSSNSWIYTQDLRKRFEERYADYRYIFVPVYLDKKNSRHNHSTTAITHPQTPDNDNSWMYSRSARDHLFYPTPRMATSVCCVTNQCFIRNQVPTNKSTKARFFKRPAKSTTSLVSKFSPHSASLSSFHTAHNLTKHQTNVVVEEDDDGNENYSVPLIKQDSIISSQTTTGSSNTNNSPVTTTQRNRLTRLRSFFFKTSSLSDAQTPQRTSLSSSSTRHQISKT